MVKEVSTVGCTNKTVRVYVHLKLEPSHPGFKMTKKHLDVHLKRYNTISNLQILVPWNANATKLRLLTRARVTFELTVPHKVSLHDIMREVQNTPLADTVYEGQTTDFWILFNPGSRDELAVVEIDKVEIK
jgi:hypothetical protein